MNKTCRSCLTEFPLTKEYFYSNGYTPKGSQKWKPTCKPCENSERKGLHAALIAEVFGDHLYCESCGYDKCVQALDFHHTDPEEKEYSIAKFQSSRRNRDVVIKELEKCVILCANCHREHHSTK